jgi:Holliday junction resolvase-like predicted endonuclease
MARLLLTDGLIDVVCMQINVFEAVEVKQKFSRKTAGYIEMVPTKRFERICNKVHG